MFLTQRANRDRESHRTEGHGFKPFIGPSDSPGDISSPLEVPGRQLMGRLKPKLGLCGIEDVTIKTIKNGINDGFMVPDFRFGGVMLELTTLRLAPEKRQQCEFIWLYYGLSIILITEPMLLDLLCNPKQLLELIQTAHCNQQSRDADKRYYRAIQKAAQTTAAWRKNRLAELAKLAANGPQLAKPRKSPHGFVRPGVSATLAASARAQIRDRTRH
jgi:hypothetical protein